MLVGLIVGAGLYVAPFSFASADYDGEPLADRWPLSAPLRELAQRWEIVPERDLALTG